MAAVGHDGTVMPDPFLVILGFIALLCIVLFPVRLWRQKRHRYGNEDEGGEEVPLAPPERRNQG
jgi:hypothetical protein